MTFCFQKSSLVHSRSRTYNTFLLGYFGMNFLLYIRHFVYCVLADIWVPNSSHKICNIFFCSSLLGLKWRFVCAWNCLIFFLGEYSSVWPEICRVLSQIQSRFLRGISGKNYFRRIFQKFCANQGSLPKLVKFRPTFCNFFLGSYCLEKVHTSAFICCLHPGKETRPQTKNKKKIRGRKTKTFCFRKNSFVHSLGLGLTTPYSLGILVWIFYQTFVILPIEFWPIFETQIRPTRFVINFLFITVKAERKVRLCVKLFYFFPRRILICLAWNLSLFFRNSSRFLREILGKNYFGRIFHKFCANQGYHLPKLMKFRPTFCNFILDLYCIEKVQKNAFICFLHPGKEARPYTIYKKKIWLRKYRTFCFRRTSFVLSRSGTYYAPLLGYFRMKFLPHIRHCVYWVLSEIWAPNSSHNICN